MKLIEGFRLRPLGKEFIVTPESVAQINFNTVNRVSYIRQS